MIVVAGKIYSDFRLVFTQGLFATHLPNPEMAGRSLRVVFKESLATAHIIPNGNAI